MLFHVTIQKEDYITSKIEVKAETTQEALIKAKSLKNVKKVLFAKDGY